MKKTIELARNQLGVFKYFPPENEHCQMLVKIPKPTIEERNLIIVYLDMKTTSTQSIIHTTTELNIPDEFVRNGYTLLACRMDYIANHHVIGVNDTIFWSKGANRIYRNNYAPDMGPREFDISFWKNPNDECVGNLNVYIFDKVTNTLEKHTTEKNGLYLVPELAHKNGFIIYICIGNAKPFFNEPWEFDDPEFDEIRDMGYKFILNILLPVLLNPQQAYDIYIDFLTAYIKNHIDDNEEDVDLPDPLPLTMLFTKIDAIKIHVFLRNLKLVKKPRQYDWSKLSHRFELLWNNEFDLPMKELEEEVLEKTPAKGQSPEETPADETPMAKEQPSEDIDEIPITEKQPSEEIPEEISVEETDEEL